MSVSLSSIPATDVDMRASSKRGIVNVESEPSWVASFERRIEQVLGLHQTRLGKHDAELSSQRQLLEVLRSEIGLLRKVSVEQSKQFSDMSSDTASTSGSFTVGLVTQAEWCLRTVLVRGWAPFGSPASQKIDRIESTRKLQTNCSLVCFSVYRTTLWSERRSLQTTRFLLG